MNKPEFDIIPSHKLDKQQWDACIENSNSPLIYAYTYYLDHMADNWSGIVLNDYEAVMPVPWRRKFGIQYCYDVPFIQQLGSFSKIEYGETFFLDILVDAFKYGDYHFNYNNKALFLKSNTNYILDLSTEYAGIRTNYKSDLLNNLYKAVKEPLKYEVTHFIEAIDLYKKLYAARLVNVKPNDYENLKKLCGFLDERKQVLARKVVDNNNNLLATALLLNDGKRLYNIANSTTKEGRQKEANQFLFDEMFKEFAGSDLIFDFEGSDIPGVKSFYEKFGAVNQPYYSLHFNKLSPLIKWLKK